MSDTPQNPLEGLLSEFSLGPAWARAKSDKPSEKAYEGPEREYQPRRREGGRDDRRQGGGARQGGGFGGRSENRGDGRQGGDRRKFDRNRGGRPDNRREEIAPAEGVTVTLIPEKHAIQLICKEVHQVARVYPLFDIAQIILAERARSRAVFEISEKHPAFYRCKIEEAIYLTKEEAMRHLLSASWRDRFIEESTIEVDPPKGNFTSVARCGISGEWLGPPNHHDYQKNLRRIHRERFANMPFEVYATKVRTERSEEAVNEWIESMRTQTRWRILSNKEIAERTAAAKLADEKALTAESAKTKVQGPTEIEAIPQQKVPEAQEKTEQKAEIEEVTVQDSDSSPSNESNETPEISEPAGNEEPATSIEPQDPSTAEADSAEPAAEKPAEEITWITDRAEIERLISQKILERAFHLTRKAKVSAAIAGKHLSPGLLIRLKQTGNHHRKHPAIIIPAVCRILESEHMPVFKRKGKLYTGPARPHALAPDAVLAPRPSEMVKWIRENTPAKLEGLWQAILPEGAKAPPQEYAADLFWLLQQGHILLYTDDTLVVQEQPKPQEPKKAKKKAKQQPEKKDAPTTLSQEPSGKSENESPASVENTSPAEQQDQVPEDSDENATIADTGTEPTLAASAEIVSEVLKDTVETIADAATALIDAAIPTDKAPASETEKPAGSTAAPAAENPENKEENAGEK
ncbi:hypothetical protein ACFSSA_15285 [Luteolibacter algae]|uniref:Uncharacterized protein n=1 Tax=Luteolibacter algae TaxID=454151 RepID=A0ABW5DA86_9BACT